LETISAKPFELSFRNLLRAPNQPDSIYRKSLSPQYRRKRRDLDLGRNEVWKLVEQRPRVRFPRAARRDLL